VRGAGMVDQVQSAMRDGASWLKILRPYLRYRHSTIPEWGVLAVRERDRVRPSCATSNNIRQRRNHDWDPLALYREPDGRRRAENSYTPATAWIARRRTTLRIGRPRLARDRRRLWALTARAGAIGPSDANSMGHRRCRPEDGCSETTKRAIDGMDARGGMIAEVKPEGRGIADACMRPTRHADMVVDGEKRGRAA